MKRSPSSFSFFLFLLISFSLMSFSSEVVAKTVYITKTGKKYHTKSCRYGKTGLATTLANAKKKGLTACLVCKPSTTESKTTEPTSIKSNTSITRPT